MWSAAADTVMGEDLKDLPGPVYLYFKHVLAEDQHAIGLMCMSQTGILRTGSHRKRWMKFGIHEGGVDFMRGLQPHDQMQRLRLPQASL